MKNGFLFIFLIFQSIHIFAQFTATIIDAKDKKGIAYVSIYIPEENIGITADENGKFTIKTSLTSKLIFSALGYENKSVAFADLKEIIELSPKFFELNEIRVFPKQMEELKINTFSETEIKNSFASSTVTPTIYARYFPYDTIYQHTPFIKSIKTSVRSFTKNSIFNIKIYGVKHDGGVGKELTNKNILVKTKKGIMFPITDVSKLNIQFPEDGLFIGLENLLLESNKYDSKELLNWPKDKPFRMHTYYSPLFNNVVIKDNFYTWVNMNGQWEIVSKNYSDNHMFKYSKLAIELTLSN
ncbi:hypothetical protein A5893_09820 [Pedobacter psychrophilus]|uniref:Carboxypeptidase-like regulatory domain-containing protein n=1 Tax=Pedobacter psychrophilus TaxID=1826909 RepID=A0A179DFX5_9SPHI|nr:carboxypeptidase-like regulatory domain-containing protein [Pedobacter psychrophilus]OAQ39858.1 hypothetical protein A5893_09820 [Pedobacter psychrophilus]